MQYLASINKVKTVVRKIEAFPGFLHDLDGKVREPDNFPDRTRPNQRAGVRFQGSDLPAADGKRIAADASTRADIKDFTMGKGDQRADSLPFLSIRKTLNGLQQRIIIIAIPC